MPAVGITGLTELTDYTGSPTVTSRGKTDPALLPGFEFIGETFTTQHRPPSACIFTMTESPSGRFHRWSATQYTHCLVDRSANLSCAPSIPSNRALTSPGRHDVELCPEVDIPPSLTTNSVILNLEPSALRAACSQTSSSGNACVLLPVPPLGTRIRRDEPPEQTSARTATTSCSC